jgi:hypothetical protein
MEGYCSTGQSPQRAVVRMEKRRNYSSIQPQSEGCTTQRTTECRVRMFRERETRNVGLLIKGGEEIEKIWRHARALESPTRRNVSSSTFLFLFRLCSVLRTFFLYL